MPLRGPGSARYNADQYPWLLTADPPICRAGPALGVLRRCERLRRGEDCLCRFAAADIAEDLVRSGSPELAEYFTTALEPEDVEELASELSAHLAQGIDDAELAEALQQVRRNIGRLIEAEAGLTDRLSDDLD